MDKDELGAVRHAMTAKELNDLYKSLENFIVLDCTRSEVDANRDALNKVQNHDTPTNEINNKIVITAGETPGINN